MTTVTAAPIKNYNGSRLARITFEGRRVEDDGTVVKCGHWGHKTEDAAKRCAEGQA